MSHPYKKVGYDGESNKPKANRLMDKCGYAKGGRTIINIRMPEQQQEPAPIPPSLQPASRPPVPPSAPPPGGPPPGPAAGGAPMPMPVPVPMPQAGPAGPAGAPGAPGAPGMLPPGMPRKHGGRTVKPVDKETLTTAEQKKLLGLRHGGRAKVKDVQDKGAGYIPGDSNPNALKRWAKYVRKNSYQRGGKAKAT